MCLMCAYSCSILIQQRDIPFPRASPSALVLETADIVRQHTLQTSTPDH